MHHMNCQVHTQCVAATGSRGTLAAGTQWCQYEGEVSSSWAAWTLWCHGGSWYTLCVMSHSPLPETAELLTGHRAIPVWCVRGSKALGRASCSPYCDRTELGHLGAGLELGQAGDSLGKCCGKRGLASGEEREDLGLRGGDLLGSLLPGAQLCIHLHLEALIF